VARWRVLHAIHDFLPRHRAGSEIYAYDLASALAARHDVWVLSAEYDPSANHGALRWRTEGTLPVIEIVNNWEFRSFDESYASARLNDRITHVLDAVRPDIVHVHNLLNLSLDLPRLARGRGVPTVATLHDYTMVCISGGQRVHRAEQHVCDTIDADRCARCFGESPFGPQLTAGRIAAVTRGRPLLKVAAAARRRVPALATSLGNRAARGSIEPSDVRRRLAYVRHVFDTIDLFVAPSASLAGEYIRLGVPADRMIVSENGCGAHVEHSPRDRDAVLSIGYVGSLVWHKGIHVLLQAARGLGGPFRITIHGDTTVSPEYTRDLERLASGLPVTFAGPFDRADVNKIYGAMDVLVVPSLWPENAPVVLQEAFLNDVTVVAAAVGGIPETVRDGENGRLFDPRSPGTLGAILQSFIDDPSRRMRLAPGATPVKTIAADAIDWEARYAGVLAAARSQNAVRPGSDQGQTPKSIAPRRKDRAISVRPAVSIVTLTRNGMRTLPRWITAIEAQTATETREVIAADSASTDGTREFLESSGVRVLGVDPRSFNHGETRNYAVEHARGDLIVLIVQDAVPIGTEWLQALVAPVAADASVAGAFARQVPAGDSSALTRWSLERWLACGLEPRRSDPLSRREFDALAPLARYERCIFDNVCSCIRRSAWQRHRFRAAPIAEDLEWARDVLLDGWSILYVPDAVVEHSHDRDPMYELRRTYLVHRRLQELFGLSTVPTAQSLIGAIARTVPAHLRVTRFERQPAAAWARAAALGIVWPAGQYFGARAARVGRPAPRFRDV